MKIENHPTVKWYQEQFKAEQDREPSRLRLSGSSKWC